MMNSILRMWKGNWIHTRLAWLIAAGERLLKFCSEKNYSIRQHSVALVMIQVICLDSIDKVNTIPCVQPLFLG